MTAIEVGSGLAEVLAAQRDDEQAVGYPQLEKYAVALARLSRDSGDPCVWPVGCAAERLAGAAVVVSAGRTRVRGWSSDLAGDRVLLVTVAAVTPLPLLMAAEQARNLGAAEVLACGVHVQGMDESRYESRLSYCSLA